MKPTHPTHRNGTAAVYTHTLFERGRVVTVHDVWCEDLDCEDRGCLGSFRDRGKAIRLAGRHRHRLLPALSLRGPRLPAEAIRMKRARVFLAVSAALFVASFLLAATWAALLIQPAAVPAP